MNKIMRLGSLFFTFVLLGLSALRYIKGSDKSAIYYLIGAIGFSLVYYSYRKKERSSK